MADEGNEIALTAGFDPQNAEAVLGIVERDAVDQSCQDLRRARHVAESDRRERVTSGCLGDTL
jgi:hypothetical protein